MPRTKRIFISDIHMGDANSMTGPKPYCWFRDNINNLADFLGKQLSANDIKEVVILGDLFDEWVIPTYAAPLTTFKAICSNATNAPVIKKLKELAASPDIKLAYVPGNHDMSMNSAGLDLEKTFLESQFPGIRYICKSDVPLGTYNVGTIAAEHGDRYCLFNAPDICTATDTFLPIGYFISRIVAYKVATTGKKEDYLHIFTHFLRDLMKNPDLINDLLLAIAQDARLPADSTFNLLGISGFNNNTNSVNDIIKRYKNIARNWEKTPGNINAATAIISDAGNLSYAASLAYFWQMHSNINIVIFGHTHTAAMDKRLVHEPDPEKGELEQNIPSTCIYANSGSWVDTNPCTYVETEEAGKRHYVRVKSYPGNSVIHEGFVEM